MAACVKNVSDSRRAHQAPGDTRPVRDLLGGKTSPAALLTFHFSRPVVFSHSWNSGTFPLNRVHVADVQPCSLDANRQVRLLTRLGSEPASSFSAVKRGQPDKRLVID